MTAPKVIVDLVEKFKQNIDQYRSQTYNEAQLRREFLDPFLKPWVGMSVIKLAMRLSTVKSSLKIR